MSSNPATATSKVDDMTEPTEADYAAYDAMMDRAREAKFAAAHAHPSRYFKAREFAQAIAEARAQGRLEERDACAKHAMERQYTHLCSNCGNYPFDIGGARCSVSATGRRYGGEAA